ncbi:MAG: aminoacetone oxidase family FAD-binding enzyme [Anaerolineae bacterium]|nr:aminoacetone oxidase family FAD-binding enzyme [Anaerolineae bacterium]
MNETCDILIVGAGAAGLMAAIFAGRQDSGRKILVLDGAKKPGAKILVSGGSRCNVTHDIVEASAFAGSSRNAIGKVLRRFDVDQTVKFFQEIGVPLKREVTGKLFPVTDSARTVLDALMREARRTGVTFQYPYRVQAITRRGGGFEVLGEWGSITAQKVVLATGGKSLPRSGSDGYGYTLARALGHNLTKRIFPALVPLTLPPDHFVCGLSGITLPTTLTVVSSTGKKLVSFTDSTLCTHFGLSGPSVLDISRYYLEAAPNDAALLINWLPEIDAEQFERGLQTERRPVGRMLQQQFPERLARALCDYAGVDAANSGMALSRQMRKSLAQTVTTMNLPVTGDRGFTYAEVTAGGIPLAEIRLETMESRGCSGLYLCGEICDVDGRIGGYNFQWAWSSGYTVGVSV